jgi:hypothetical protein
MCDGAAGLSHLGEEEHDDDQDFKRRGHQPLASAPAGHHHCHGDMGRPAPGPRGQPGGHGPGLPPGAATQPPARRPTGPLGRVRPCSTPLLHPQELPGAAAVERSVDVATVPVDELHPDRVGMRPAPRGPHDQSRVELVGQFLNRRVYFLTWDGQRVEAEVAGFGALSDELYLARAAHAPGPGPTISLWIPALDAYCWANPESLTVCGTLPENRLGPALGGRVG